MSKETKRWTSSLVDMHDLPVAYTEVDERGVIRLVNEQGCRMIGMPAEALVGHEVWEFLSSDDSKQSRADFFRAIESGEEPAVVRRSIYRAFGAYLTHELHRRLVRDEEGRVVGMSLVMIDVSDAETEHREALQTRQWLESALGAIPQAVVVTDALGFVRSMNGAAERLTGWVAAELVGLPIERGVSIVRAVSRGETELSFLTTLDEAWNGDVELETRAGERVCVWLSASPVLDQETGYVNGVVTVLGTPRAKGVAVA
jgi:PAS domain S-box-containing protein